MTSLPVIVPESPLGIVIRNGSDPTRGASIWAYMWADDAEDTREHISRSLCCSIDKAHRLLGYTPRYTALEAVRESVDRLMADGVVKG